MKQCPNCGRKLSPKDGGGSYCNNCGFVNDPNYRGKDVNDREDKILYNLWLTKDEERLLREALKNRIYSIAWTLIVKAYKRGDFEKNG